ncbi:hypothetical protein D3874_00775 [Oleomonas cavernae]|uniref:Phosphate ABC transporter substrate-binding protein n=1 Tax=Oleomonas cavernae TaxID=2320859 RepID=A0A418WUG4_9PROT|nr:hypothetical protein D3874_00775 [Oleomonas cavernae]
MLASLGMYDQPWLQQANDAIWAVLARQLRLLGVAAPGRLERTRTLGEIWLDPDLLLGQTCGYPLVTFLAGRVRMVATPCYDTPYTDGPDYRSVIVVRADGGPISLAGLRGARAAVNEATSNSGMNFLRAVVAPLARRGRFFSTVRYTGAHIASMAAVAAGEADVAAIDGVTFTLTARHRPDLVAGLRILTQSPSVPGLPLVTRPDAPDDLVATLRAALDGVIAEPTLAPARAALGLVGFAQVPPERYQAILDLEAEAARLGYPILG